VLISVHFLLFFPSVVQQKSWRIFETSAARHRGPSASCCGLAGIKLGIGLGSSPANSPRADVDVFRVVAKEEGGDAGRQPQETC
jgi:hypothetical protein